MRRRPVSGGEVEMGGVDGEEVVSSKKALSRYGGKKSDTGVSAAAAGSSASLASDKKNKGKKPSNQAAAFAAAVLGAGDNEEEEEEKQHQQQNEEKERPPMLRRNSSQASRRSARSTLQLMEDAVVKTTRICDVHKTYQWICLPYLDKWLPWPSKKTLTKTLNRLDFNSFNPFDVFDEYYHSFTSPLGILFTLGCVALLVIYSIFAAQVLLKDNLVQQDSFEAVPASGAALYWTGAATGLVIAAVPVDGGPATAAYFDPALLTSVAVRARVCTVVGNGAASCDNVTLTACTLGTLNSSALCATDADGFRMGGYSTFGRVTYSVVEVVDLGTAAAALPGAAFSLVGDGQVMSDFRRTEAGNPNAPYAASFRYRPGATVEGLVTYRAEVADFPSKVLRDPIIIPYTTFYQSQESSGPMGTDSVIFRLTMRMDPTLHRRRFIGETFLDTVSNVGGILMLIKIVVLVFSVYIVQEAFKKSKKLNVNPKTAKALLKKKEEQLQRLKDDLISIRANETLRLTDLEMYSYINGKRDAELTTYRNALFSSLNTRSRGGQVNVQEVWDIGDAPAEETVDDAHKVKRLDELQELVRIDEAEREKNPQLPRMLNILAMDDIQRQTRIMQQFLSTVR